jgi:hypothetical protein
MATWEVYIGSDIYLGAWTEDGDRREELAFFAVCEDASGRRFRSTLSWRSGELGREVAEARAEAFEARARAALAVGADPSRSPKWVRTQGRYGSVGWSEREELRAEADALEVESGRAEADRFRREAGL